MESFTIMVPVKLTIEDIDNIVETAMEDSYGWFSGYRKEVNGWTIRHEDTDADEPETFKDSLIGYYVLAEAIQKYLASRMDARIAFDDELAHQIDLGDADSIVQLACYNEIVFG